LTPATSAAAADFMVNLFRGFEPCAGSAGKVVLVSATAAISAWRTAA
jgi:hypothetical protein